MSAFIFCFPSLSLIIFDLIALIKLCTPNKIFKIKTLHYESWEIIVNNFLSLSLLDRTYFTVCVSGGTSATPGVILLDLITLLFLKTSHVLQVVFKNGLLLYIALCFLHWHFNILVISNAEEIYLFKFSPREIFGDATNI